MVYYHIFKLLATRTFVDDNARLHPTGIGFERFETLSIEPSDITRLKSYRSCMGYAIDTYGGQMLYYTKFYVSIN